MRRSGWVTLLMACVLWAGWGVSTAYAQRQGNDPLENAVRTGDYERARSLSLRHDDVPSLLVRALLSEYEGDLTEAARFAGVALKKASKPEDKIKATVFVARMERASGDVVAAEKRLRDTLKASINAHAVRFELGDLLWSQGKHAEARSILDVFTMLFNNGALKKSEDLMYLGRSMQVMNSFDDANYAFQQAYNQDARDVENLVAWGMLLLSKYNIPDADRSFTEALAVNKNHPGALVGKAIIQMATSNRGDKAREFLGRAEQIAPALPDLLLTRSHLALRDNDCMRARKHAGTLLKVRPQHLEGLTINVTCDYLDDDMKAFKASKGFVLKLNPKYVDVLATTAQYAIRVHRYVEAMSLYREALKINPEHADSLLGLGIGLSRIGKEDEAVDYLKKAFEVDPYNVRAFNMVELYDKEMPKYNFTEYKGFKVRSYRDQSDLVEMFVAPVVRAAMDVFTRKYKFEPHKYLAVEVYSNPTTFSVRSVGLPNISPHGICFGRVVTVRSPSDGNFNWRQVVWHELAHVYHIQLSNSRVPRWFTEGLAEYETNVHDPAWLRHHDREIAVKLFKEGIPSVLNFNRGFTHARSYGEILRSYHLSSLSLHFIAQTWGFEAIPKMLRTWGQKKNTTQVIAEVLKVDIDGFDAKFLVWLKTKYMTFEHQMMWDAEEVESIPKLKKKLRRNELNSKVHAQLAVALARARQFDKAEASLKRALEISPNDPEINYVALMFRQGQGRLKDALAHGDKILGAGRDSYDLRVALGRAALGMEKIEDARVHFLSATQLYPTGKEAWIALSKIAKNTKDDAGYKKALGQIYLLNQHDPSLARLRTELFVRDGKHKEAWETLGRWMDTNPFDPAYHRMRIDVGMKLNKREEVVSSWSAMLLLRKSEKKDVYLEAISTLSKAGWKAQAQAFAEQARKETLLKVPEAEITKALSGK